MPSRKVRLLLACTSIIPVGYAFAAQAEEKPANDTTVLEQVLVKGNRVTTQKGSATDTPLAKQVSREKLDAKQITSVQDLGRVAEPGSILTGPQVPSTSVAWKEAAC